MKLRLQTFGAKLLVLFVVVVAAAQFGTWFIVSNANEAQARSLIDEELQRAASTYARVVEERNALLAAAATTAARDYAFRSLFGAEEIDAPTIASTLESLLLRTNAHYAAALGLDAKPLASTAGAPLEGDILAQLVARADADPRPEPRANGYGYLERQLHSLVVVPVRTPDIAAWLVVGFRIDGDFARRLKQQTGIDLTFADQNGRVLATTLADPGAARTVAGALATMRNVTGSTTLSLGRETALVATREMSAGTGRATTLALQYSLDEKLAPAHATERLLLVVASGALLLAGYVSHRFARRLSRPVEQLAEHTKVIARGDYATPLTLRRADELGRLADSFRAMTAGLAERDRVRDLLDKNVSPEVAAQLLRDGATLGGEEREVTILFSDLRGFTTMSEQLAPRELLALLNRYLDAMSTEIERHGGVIDKFIGDAIMALFGAPVAQRDPADRAIAAALGMEKALARLNAQLAAEGRPALALGVGINTARVVAGNIGSHRRLNYSVIGDGVNVASRLQSLTRTPEFATNVITSAATLAALRRREAFTTRPLGRVQVKGRAEPVEIFAVAR